MNRRAFLLGTAAAAASTVIPPTKALAIADIDPVTFKTAWDLAGAGADRTAWIMSEWDGVALKPCQMWVGKEAYAQMMAALTPPKRNWFAFELKR